MAGSLVLLLDLADNLFQHVPIAARPVGRDLGQLVAISVDNTFDFGAYRVGAVAEREAMREVGEGRRQAGTKSPGRENLGGVIFSQHGADLTNGGLVLVRPIGIVVVETGRVGRVAVGGRHVDGKNGMNDDASRRNIVKKGDGTGQGVGEDCEGADYESYAAGFDFCQGARGGTLLTARGYFFAAGSMVILFQRAEGEIVDSA